MKYHISNDSEDSSEVVVSLNGVFTYRDHGVFDNIINELQKMTKNGSLIFDLSRVEFIDSSIVGVFSLIGEKASDKNIAVYMRGANGEVRDIMCKVGFDRLFTFC